MKNIYNILVIPIFCLAILSCSNSTDFPELKCNESNISSNQTVEHVKLFTNTIAQKYTYDDIIEAYIISSDQGGNFFKTISCQTIPTENNPAIGLSIAIDASNTYIDYRLGNKVLIKLKDQFLDIYHGGLRIGSLYESNFGMSSVGRISQNDYKNVLLATCTIINEEELVQKLSITEALHDQRINTLVELQDVQFLSDALGRSYFEESNNTGGATNWSLQDKSGSQIYFRTSSYASFSNQKVPSGNGSIRGVITKYGSDFQFLARFPEDIKLSNNRNDPFFSENFQTVTASGTINLPGWTNIVESGTLYWKGGLSSENGFAQYAITGTKVVSNIGWLITPPINMDEHENEILTFRTAQEDLDVDSPLNSLQVLVSSDFDGVHLQTATWIQLNPNIVTQIQPKNEFIGSGPIDLSSFTGNIRIAFKYIGSGKDLALDATFMIDDVSIYGD